MQYPYVDILDQKTPMLCIVLYWRHSGTKYSRSTSRSNSALNSSPPIYTCLHIFLMKLYSIIYFNVFFPWSYKMLFKNFIYMIFFYFFKFFITYYIIYFYSINIFYFLFYKFFILLFFNLIYNNYIAFAVVFIVGQILQYQYL